MSFVTNSFHAFNKPIVSSSANFSGEPSPVMFKDISDELKKKVDYVVQNQPMQKIKQS